MIDKRIDVDERDSQNVYLPAHSSYGSLPEGGKTLLGVDLPGGVQYPGVRRLAGPGNHLFINHWPINLFQPILSDNLYLKTRVYTLQGVQYLQAVVNIMVIDF